MLVGICTAKIVCILFFWRSQLIQIQKKNYHFVKITINTLPFLFYDQNQNMSIECDLNFFFIQIAIQIEKFICSNLPSFNCKL